MTNKLKEGVAKAIFEQVKKSKENKLSKEDIENSLTIPPNVEMGDFAFPCFKLSAVFKKSPVEIAKQLEKEIKLKGNIVKVSANN